MPIALESERGARSNSQLLVIGSVFVVVTVAVVAGLIAKSRGELDRTVPVTADLVEIGDGLPVNADVKFRGVLVGSVRNVTPATAGQPNQVSIGLNPHYVSGIPNTITARVVPSNIFAVSSVQLVDNGEGLPLHAGARIAQDTSLPTVQLQTALTKLRDIVATVGKTRRDTTVGVVAALADATRAKGDELVRAGQQLDRLVAQTNSVMEPDGTATTVKSLTTAIEGLQTSAPELLDALHQGIVPLRTIAEKRVELADFLSAGLYTFGTVADAFDNQTDRLIAITTQLTPVVGVLADNRDKFVPIGTELTQLSHKILAEAWNPITHRLFGKAIVNFTPTRQYTRADCPRYGALEGPSCKTAPTGQPTKSWPLDPMDPRSYRLPPELSGGNVGPVGSPQEMEKLGEIMGTNPDAADALLLGPLARGATVTVAPAPGAAAAPGVAAPPDAAAPAIPPIPPGGGP